MTKNFPNSVYCLWTVASLSIAIKYSSFTLIASYAIFSKPFTLTKYKSFYLYKEEDNIIQLP